MAKATVNAKEFVNDVRAGMGDDELMRRHGLTNKQFRAVCETLLEAGKLRPSDLGKEPSTSDFTFGVASTCPHCGAMKLIDSGECPQCGEPTISAVTGSGALDLDFPNDKDDSSAGGPADSQRGLRTEPQTVDPKWSPSPAEPHPEPIEPAPVEATVTTESDFSAVKPAGPTRARRLVSIALAATLPVVAIALAAGWYMGIIVLPFDQLPDVPAVTAQKTPVPAPMAVKKAKPAAPAAEAKQTGPTEVPPQATEPARPATASAPPPQVASASPATGNADAKPFQEVPAGAANHPVTQAPPAETVAIPGPAPRSKAVLAVAEARPTPAPSDPEKVSDAEKPRQNEAARVPVPQHPNTLAAAVRRGDVAAVRQFLDRWDNVNARDEDGVTACMLAAVQGDADMVELLIQHGADVNATDSMGSTALSLAIEGGNPRVVKMLLAKDRGKGAAELLDACRTGRGDVVSVLLQSGVDLNSQDEQGNTLLMLAVRSGDLPLVKMLLERGADTTVRNRQGVTALAWAYSSPMSESAPARVRREIVQLLKQHGDKSGASKGPTE